jgi:hypothetical protein
VAVAVGVVCFALIIYFIEGITRNG